jgi:exosome complex protein LRP1
MSFVPAPLICRSLNAVPEPGTKLDKDAAGRFIKHAIARFSKQSDQAEPTPPSIFVPVKVTSKMAARAEYERELKEQPAELSDEELQVFDDSKEDDDGDESSIDIDEPSVENTGPTLGNFDGNDQLQSSLKKRKRPSVDPFAGTSFVGLSYGSQASKNHNRLW